MPRKARMYLPGVPAHVVQRGNNRDACFFAEEDFQFYKEVLAEGLKRYGAQLHAYCLMTNHVHLLITPHFTDSISRILQHIGRQYVCYINKTYKRSGTLWEGRHKSSLVDAENYLLACYRYIELNPVVAGMVKMPNEYPWSSYPANAHGKNDLLLTPHEIYLRIHPDKLVREKEYRELFRANLSMEDVHAIRESLSANQILGAGRFKEQIESALERKVGFLSRGRPRVTG
jgi:putative transposase